eukprot:GHVN01077047.1.p1 GENE.GHVN01077047.1~~GHVN01077047.1.p1  ORF type:complete len:661 (-),score=52.42 GHVN01077047.1:881-2863(-)
MTTLAFYLQNRLLELRPLIHASAQAASLPPLQALHQEDHQVDTLPNADIRQSCSPEDFPLTIKNAATYSDGGCCRYSANHLHPSEETYPVDIRELEQWDCAFVWPYSPAGEDEEMLDDYQVRMVLMRAMVYRGHQSPDVLPPLYHIEEKNIHAMTRHELIELLYNTFTNVIASLGCHLKAFRTTVEGQIVIKVRLTESTAKAFARETRYHLQIDPQAISKEFRSLKDFVAPYAPFEFAEGEGNIRPWVAYTVHGRVWQRYDQLSRPVQVPGVNLHDNELTIFRDVDRIRLLRTMVFKFFQVSWMVDEGWMLDELTLHQYNSLERLKTDWVKASRLWTWEQPLNMIRDYYGEEWAFYFAWLGYYTKWLFAPGIVGLLIALAETIFDPEGKFENQSLHRVSFAYSVFVMVWSTLFLEMWLRYETRLAFKWGVDGTFTHSTVRADFQHDHYRPDPINPTGPMKPGYARWKKLGRRLISYAISSMFICFVVSVVLAVFAAQLYVHAHPETFGWVSDYYEDVGSLVISILIFTFERIWRLMAVLFARYENHKHEHEFRRSIALKLFVFAFVNDFNALFYVAFAKDRLETDGCPTKGCLMSLRINLRSLFYVYFALNALESGLPCLLYNLKRCRRKVKDPNPTEVQIDLVRWYHKGYVIQTFFAPS